MADNRRFKGGGHKINLGGLVADSFMPEEDTSVIEKNASNPDFRRYGNQELANEGTGESQDSIRQPMVPMQSQVNFPQYKKPGMWQNLITQGRAGQQYGQLQGQSNLAQAESESHLRNSQLLAQQTNNYNIELQKMMHDNNVDADTAKQMLSDRLKNEQMNHEADINFTSSQGLPYDPNQMSSLRQMYNSDPSKQLSFSTSMAERSARMNKANDASDADLYNIDKRTATRDSMLQTAINEAKFGQQGSEFNLNPDVSNRMFEAKANEQSMKNLFTGAQTEYLKNGNINVGGALVNKATGETLKERVNPQVQMLQSLSDKYGIGSNSGRNTNRPPAVNIQGLTPNSQPPAIDNTSSNPGQGIPEAVMFQGRKFAPRKNQMSR